MKTCKFCGQELVDEALFCGNCGNPCENTSEDTLQKEEQQETQDDNRAQKKSLAPLIVGGVLLIMASAGGSFLALRHFAGNRESAGFGQEQAELEDLFDLSQAELEESYKEPEGTGVVDLSARNHPPAARDVSALWDKELFYRLEDLGGENDNQIADCILTRMELQRADSKTPIEYEVYREPTTGQIQKIVSIETKEDGSLELSDYYYKDGRPDFVFRRSDSVYTPSYATIDKTGERYYFSGDQMVKWRWIYEPSVVKQWILELEDTWYTQWRYGDISEDERRQYDEKEAQVLNEAYNTLEAVTANEPVPVIRGRVVDEAGSPLENVEVGIGRIAGGEIQQPKVKVVTDKEGKYAWAVTEDTGEDTKSEEEGSAVQDKEYFLVFRKDGWIPSVMKLSEMGEGYLILQSEQDDMVLLKEDEEDNTITFYTYQVEPQGEQDILERAFSEDTEQKAVPVLADAAVTIYPGVNWFLGSPLAEEKSSEEGIVSVELPTGIYTAVVEKEGILPSWKVFLAGGREQKQVIYAMAANSGETTAESQAGADKTEGTKTDEEWRILLSWDSSETDPLDLDSSLFTPDKAAKGDRNCINTLNRSDHAGARLLYDGEGNNACEIITLDAPKRGSYKYYVSNYTDIQTGDLESFGLSKSGAKVTVFHNGIPVRTFSVPQKAGTVWEVFELRDQGIVPIQEVYGNVEGKGWWTEDKKLSRLSERSLTADWIQSDGEWLYFTNPMDGGRLYYCRKDGSDLTRFGEDKTIDPRILLVEDQVYYIAGRSIVRIKNDGTGRTVVQANVQQAEIDDPTFFLVGYSDGMLYYYNAPETIGGICALPVGEDVNTSAWGEPGSGMNGSTPHYTFGECPARAAVVGNYLYYLNWNYSSDGSGSFCRKSLKTGEEECLKAGVNWDLHYWSIYKGWIYYLEDGAIKRTRLMGPGSLTEEQVLTNNQRNDGMGSIWKLDGDTCYYPGNDGKIHTMALDGSSQATLPLSARYMTILDGELYTLEEFGWDLVVAAAKSGENQRKLGFGVGAEGMIGSVKPEHDSVIASVLAQELYFGCYHGETNTLTSADFTKQHVQEAAWYYLYYDYYNENLIAPENPASNWAIYADASVYYDRNKVNEAMEDLYGVSAVFGPEYYNSYDTERLQPYLEVYENKISSQYYWGNSGDPYAYVSGLKYFVEDGCLNVTGEFFIDSNGGIIAEYVPFSAKFKVNPGRRFPYQLIYLYMNI